MKSIIVDDEKQSHEYLTRLLQPAWPEVEIAGHAFGVAEGIELIAQQKPELVFLDVEMPDGTGFDLLSACHNLHFFVVFITAYNKYAEAAFRFGALDFLTKPISPDLLGEALERVKKRQSEQITLEQLQIALETLQHAPGKKLPKRMAISSSKGLEMLTVEEILFLSAEQNYTDFFYWQSGKKQKLTASLNLKAYETHFGQYPEFMKVHRSYVVNLMLVDRFLRGENVLVMRDGAMIPVARPMKAEVEARLAGL